MSGRCKLWKTLARRDAELVMLVRCGFSQAEAAAECRVSEAKVAAILLREDARSAEVLRVKRAART